MDFEESALVRLGSYRGEADRTLGLMREAEEAARTFSGRLIDLAAPTGGSGRRWAAGPYTLADLLEGKWFPTETRWFR